MDAIRGAGKATRKAYSYTVTESQGTPQQRSAPFVEVLLGFEHEMLTPFDASGADLHAPAAQS